MPPTAVETVQVAPQTLSRRSAAVGTLRANETVTVRPELAGKIEKVHFEEGQTVAAGAPLFTLDASLVRAEVNEWEANVAQSRRDTTRAQELVERKLARAERPRREALASSRSNEARLSSAQTRLAKSDHPRAVRRAWSACARSAPANTSKPARRSSHSRSSIRSSSTSACRRSHLGPASRSGQAVHGRRSMRSRARTSPARCYAIDPQLDPHGRSVALRASVDEREGRPAPGPVRARDARARQRAPMRCWCPSRRCGRRASKQFVYVVKDGKAKLVEVTTGLRARTARSRS